MSKQDESKLVRFLSSFRPVLEIAAAVATRPEAPPEFRHLVFDLVLRRKGIAADVRRLGAGEAPTREALQQWLYQLDVAARLPEDAVLVEYIRAPELHVRAIMSDGEPRQGPLRYLAFTLTRHGELDLVDLGASHAIDEHIAQWLDRMTGQGRSFAPRLGGSRLPAAVMEPAGTSLRQTILDPITRRFPNRRLIIAPDGAISFVPFQALPHDEGWVADRTHIDYVTTGRDLVRPAGGTGSTAVVVADPDYDADVRSSIPRGAPTAAGPRLPRLDGARAEGEAVAKLLGVGLLSGADAVKQRILAVESPTILHLATHGFFRPSPDAKNPLGSLRQGYLALAGANVRAADGVLDGEEAAKLALGGTDLVVLSACDSGLGDVHLGEGVLGLRRAFMVAGARSLVVSLWRVPDQQTKELMVEFYERLVEDRTAADALRQAQVAIKARHPHPYYWGAFICIGDPEARPRV